MTTPAANESAFLKTLNATQPPPDAPGTQPVQRPPLSFEQNGSRVTIMNPASRPPEAIVRALMEQVPSLAALSGAERYHAEQHLMSRLEMALHALRSDVEAFTANPLRKKGLPQPLQIDIAIDAQNPDCVFATRLDSQPDSRDLRQDMLAWQARPNKVQRSDAQARAELRLETTDPAKIEESVGTLQWLCRAAAAGTPEDSEAKAVATLAVDKSYGGQTRAAAAWLMRTLGVELADFEIYRELRDAPNLSLVDYLQEKFIERYGVLPFESAVATGQVDEILNEILLRPEWQRAMRELMHVHIHHIDQSLPLKDPATEP